MKKGIVQGGLHEKKNKKQRTPSVIIRTTACITCRQVGVRYTHCRREGNSIDRYKEVSRAEQGIDVRLYAEEQSGAWYIQLVTSGR